MQDLPLAVVRIEQVSLRRRVLGRRRSGRVERPEVQSSLVSALAVTPVLNRDRSSARRVVRPDEHLARKRAAAQVSENVVRLAACQRSERKRVLAELDGLPPRASPEADDVADVGRVVDARRTRHVARGDRSPARERESSAGDDRVLREVAS